MIEDQIERITYYEGLLTKATGILDDKSADIKQLSKAIEELESYYTSDLWKKDFAADEEGKLPADLKRGVLSEDGISNVLDRFKELSAGAKATESTKAPKSARKPLAVFYGVTLALSFLVELYCVMTQNENIILFLMWIPGIVGIICAKIFYPKQKAIGFFVKFKFRYVIYGILISRLFNATIFSGFTEEVQVPANTILSTIIVLFTGEFLPKTLFKSNPNRMMSYLPC